MTRTQAPARRAAATKRVVKSPSPVRVAPTRRSVSPAAPESDSDASVAAASAYSPDAFAALLTNPQPVDEHACQVTVSQGQRCNSTQLKPGAVLYRYARIVVLQKESGGNSRVRNQDLHAQGESADWSLGNTLVDQQCWSPDQYTQVVPVTMTQMAAKLKDEVGDCVCKVEFTKLPNPTAMADLLQKGCEMIQASGVSEREKTKMFKQLHARSLEGEYRIMRGYLLRGDDQTMRETDTGMVWFTDADLMAEGKQCERQVNVRTIKALTYKLTKYVVK